VNSTYCASLETLLVSWSRDKTSNAFRVRNATHCRSRTRAIPAKIFIFNIMLSCPLLHGILFYESDIRFHARMLQQIYLYTSNFYVLGFSPKRVTLRSLTSRALPDICSDTSATFFLQYRPTRLVTIRLKNMCDIGNHESMFKFWQYQKI